MLVADFIRKHPLRAMVGLGMVLYVFSAIFWWTQVYHTPQRAFADMLVNNLTTHSVTKDITLDETTDQLSQQVRLQLGSVNAARWIVTASQGADRVVTESIGTPTKEYVRYLSIAGENSAATKEYQQFIEQWGVQSADSTGGTGLFYQALLDINYAPTLPVGAVPAEAREALLDYIDNEQIFTPDYTTVKTVQVNGRSAYEMKVAVRQAPYVRMLQAYEKDFGFTALNDVSATQYQTQPDDTITIAIDTLSHQLMKLSYDRTGYTVLYRDHGLTDPIAVPTAAIPIEQLRQRLSEVGS